MPSPSLSRVCGDKVDTPEGRRGESNKSPHYCARPECRERAIRFCDRSVRSCQVSHLASCGCVQHALFLAHPLSCCALLSVSVLACGCPCSGVRDESRCLPCLSHQLDVAAELCAICGTEPLAAAACVQLDAPCLHVFHFDCLLSQLRARWPTPRLSFRFLLCPLCAQPLSHSALSALLAPLLAVKGRVEQLALTRLYHEGRDADAAVIAAGGRFHNAPLTYAMHTYAFYQCYKVRQASPNTQPAIAAQPAATTPS